MTDLARHPLDADYVDRLIDQVVADPNRVDDVKALLKHKIAAPDALKVVPENAASPEAVDGDDEADDMWDNVPV